MERPGDFHSRMSSSTRTSVEQRRSPLATLHRQRRRLLASAVLAIAAAGIASPAVASVAPDAVPPGTPQVTRPEPTPPSRRPERLWSDCASHLLYGGTEAAMTGAAGPRGSAHRADLP